jgi:hypothetical protein
VEYRVQERRELYLHSLTYVHVVHMDNRKFTYIVYRVFQKELYNFESL